MEPLVFCGQWLDYSLGNPEDRDCMVICTHAARADVLIMRARSKFLM